MPEIDLPTVIFALVALFVAYKLRSVLGVRQDSERQPGGLLAPLRRVPAPSTRPQSSRTERRRRPLSRLPRIAGRASPSPTPQSGAASTPSPRPIAASRRKPFFPAAARLRHGRSCLRRRRLGDVAQSDDAGSLRQFRQRNSQPRGGGPNDDDDRRVDRRRHHRRGAARRRHGAAQSAFRRQARLRHSRCPRRGRRRIAKRRRRSYRLWTFARDIRSRNPNWMLTATESESGSPSQR